MLEVYWLRCSFYTDWLCWGIRYSANCKFFFTEVWITVIILFINCLLNRFAIYVHFSLVEVSISLAILMWLSSASLGNACITMHWIVVFVLSFVFLKYVFPYFKNNYWQIFISYMFVYTWIIKKLFYFLTCCKFWYLFLLLEYV